MPDYSKLDDFMNITSRKNLMVLLGGKCFVCDESDLDILQLHHIDGNGKEDLKRFGNNRKLLYQYYATHLAEARMKFEILCANHHLKKSIANGQWMNGGIKRKSTIKKLIKNILVKHSSMKSSLCPICNVNFDWMNTVYLSKKHIESYYIQFTHKKGYGHKQESWKRCLIQIDENQYSSINKEFWVHGIKDSISSKEYTAYKPFIENLIRG